MLALLALHPEGLSLEQLHALVYGDQAVTFSTLKAEVSHLRSALGGQLASRPYRLPMPVSDRRRPRARACCAAATSARRSRRTAATCCPAPTRPALGELADYVAVALREALLADPQPDAVLRYGELAPYDTEVVEVCLAPLGTRPHPAGRCSRPGSRPPAADPSRPARGRPRSTGRRRANHPPTAGA